MSKRRSLIPPERVREVRASLKLSQREFAERLGVSRRTVIRGEQRGLEVPWATWKSRGDVRIAWDELEEDADCASPPAARAQVSRRVDPRKGDTSAIAKSPARKKRLRLSHELIKARRRPTSRPLKGRRK